MVRPVVVSSYGEGAPLTTAEGRGASTLATGKARGAIRGLTIVLLLALVGVGGRFVLVFLEHRYIATTPPAVAALDVRALFLDETPVPLTITAAWEKVPAIVTRNAVRSDPTLWRRMHVEDWDTVPMLLRHEALDAMLARYHHLLARPDVWDRMNPHDWDLVPQPIRALAFQHMVEFWSGFYQVGADHGIPRKTMTDTLAALVMSESWFDHRAINVNRWGNRDLGVGQASDQTRQRLRSLYDAGAVDVFLEDEDYFDPWKGTRFVAIWMTLLLDEVNGELDAAIRAYHRGAARARRGEGTEYLENARRRLQRFIRNEGTVGAWDYLWRRDRELTASARPWLTALVADTVLLDSSCGDVAAVTFPRDATRSAPQ